MKMTKPLTVIFLLFFMSDAFSKNCKNSQPCGNSCISWSKTCRIGGGSSYNSKPVSPRLQPSPAASLFTPSHKASTEEPVNTLQLEPLVLYAQTNATFIFSNSSYTATKIRRVEFAERFTAHDLSGEWVRVSPKNKAPQWVLGKFLSPSKP